MFTHFLPQNLLIPLFSEAMRRLKPEISTPISFAPPISTLWPSVVNFVYSQESVTSCLGPWVPPLPGSRPSHPKERIRCTHTILSSLSLLPLLSQPLLRNIYLITSSPCFSITYRIKTIILTLTDEGMATMTR